MKYVVPEMEIVALDMDDVICTSDGMIDGGVGGDGSGGSSGETTAPGDEW